MMSTKKLLPKAKSLVESLDELESKLEPLLSHPLGENLASLEKLQQAKLNVLLPYLINDLIFIYLKTQGIDPKTHPVFSELNRVREYFAKITRTEEGEKKRTTGIDKAAAGRFIKHAIAQAKQGVEFNNGNEAGPSQPSVYVPARVTEKMKEREVYLQSLKDDEDGEEQILDIVDESSTTGRDEGERREVDKVWEGKKKRRRPMDPFDSSGVSRDVDNDPRTNSKKSRKVAEIVTEDTGASSRASSVSIADEYGGGVSEKKRKKKESRKA